MHSPTYTRHNRPDARLLFGFDYYLVDAVNNGSLLFQVLLDTVVANIVALEDYFQTLCTHVLLNEDDLHTLDPRIFPYESG